MAVNAIVTIDGIRRYAYVLYDWNTGLPRFEQEWSTVDGRYSQYGPEVVTAITQDGYHHKIIRDDLEWFTAERDEMILDMPRPVMPVLEYTVTEPYEVERSAETACNFDTFEIQPGTYPVEWVDRNYQPIRPGQDAEYALIRCAAIHTRSYYVSQGFGVVLGVKDERPMTPTTYTINMYAYSADPAKLSAAYTVTAPATGEIFPPAK